MNLYSFSGGAGRIPFFGPNASVLGEGEYKFFLFFYAPDMDRELPHFQALKKGLTRKLKTEIGETPEERVFELCKYVTDFEYVKIFLKAVTPEISIGYYSFFIKLGEAELNDILIVCPYAKESTMYARTMGGGSVPSGTSPYRRSIRRYDSSTPLFKARGRFLSPDEIASVYKNIPDTVRYSRSQYITRDTLDDIVQVSPVSEEGLVRRTRKILL